MFCLLPFRLTIVKSFLALATRQSSCGTRWPNASTRFKMKDIPIGFRAYVSHRITVIRLSFRAVGIVPLRSGIWRTASSRSTIRDTMVTWILLPYHLMVRCARLAVRTLRLCCGIWMMASICTPSTTMTSLMRCASHPTDTGCALPMVHPSRFG